MIYHAPLSIDLSAKQRVKVFQDRLIASKLRYARWSARRYATTLLRLDGVNLVMRAGGEAGIAATIATYAVMPVLRQYATREVVRLLEAKGRA